MPILRLNAGNDGLSVHGSPAPAIPALRRAAHGPGPVIVMIHGFKYDPDCASCSPHSTILALKPRPDRTDDVLWPRHLGFGTGREDEGLAIAFGWRARGNIWRAQRSARSAGRHLALVVREIRRVNPLRPIHFVTHSMGSEVALEALENLPANSVDRVIALTGASYVSRAKAALLSPAGKTVEFFNIISRENDLFDFMFECLTEAPVASDRALGAGVDAANAVNIQIDCARSLWHIASFGGHVAAPTRRVCHWSGYTRPGAMAFCSLLMRKPHRIPLDTLQDILPENNAPRWSRLRKFMSEEPHLPNFEKAAS